VEHRQGRRAATDERHATTADASATPEPPKPLKLPKGMSTGVARLLFNPHDLRAPGGSRIPFTLTGKIAKAWLKHGLDSIPEGKAGKKGSGQR
jgi:hypothetical protein